MAAATATLAVGIDIQPTLNAQGLPTGLDFTMAPNVISQSVPITARRAFSINLPNIGSTQAIGFGDLTTGQIMVLAATVAGVYTPIRIQLTEPSASNFDGWMAVFAYVVDITHPFTACTVTATAANTLVDVLMGG
jgi:hypothetical protein